MQTEKLTGVTRPLLEPERRAVQRSLDRCRYRLRVMPRRVLSFGLVLFVLPLAIIAAVTRSIPPLGPAGGWFLIVLLCSIWSYFGAKRDLTRDVQRYEETLQRNEGCEVRVQSAEMVEFEEEEDEGACYAFALDGRVLFLCGQDYYGSAKFPNTDFSLVSIYDANGRCVEELIHKRGKKLEPSRTIPAKVKSEMFIPDHLDHQRRSLGVRRSVDSC